MPSQLQQMNLRLLPHDRSRVDALAERLGVSAPALVRAILHRDLAALEATPDVLEDAIVTSLRSLQLSRTKVA